MQHLILASSSPRRKELLENLHLTFDISSSDADESYAPGTPPAQIVMELAERKSKDVAQRFQDSFVIGADTIVVCDNEVLGKPKDEAHATEMLMLLFRKNSRCIYWSGHCSR